ncbi:MAG: tRNA pseudouridine(38-40) synthase TruA [Clostridia bacterium]|nr:tRNA pseudouridine(38-40) synthase TruA [Clostridia bacterium]
MRNIGLLLSYDGTCYAGWQKQNNAMTVQEAMETAITEITGSYSFLEGCGRTDAGVHALCYLATFKTESAIPAERFPFALNTKLPPDIRVFSAFDADADFHGRFSVQKKTYRYEIYNTRHENPFWRQYAWHFPYVLDVQKMHAEAQKFVGAHDFLGFMASGGQVKTTVREIYETNVFEENGKIVFEVTGNGFLYNMVRIMAGTLCYIGAGKITEDLAEIIKSKDRSRAGITAPPQGLYMKKVYFGEAYVENETES